MSCALFTFLGLYVVYFGKSNKWLITASAAAAVGLLLFAAYQVWREEHCENVRLKADETKKARLHDIKERLSEYAAAGSRLVNDAPQSPNEVEAWITSVNEWANEANNYILKNCSQLVSLKFRDTSNILDSVFPGKHNTAWPVMRTAGKMAQNLREIVENEQTYLSVISDH
jgi:hypothetical protein